MDAVLAQDASLPRRRPSRRRTSIRRRLRVEDPVFGDADAEIFLALLDVVAVLAALADDLDDDLGDPAGPDVAGPSGRGGGRSAWSGWRSDFMPGQPEPAFAAAGPVVDHAGMGDRR